MQRPPSSAFAAEVKIGGYQHQAVLPEEHGIITSASIAAIEPAAQMNQSSEDDVRITFGIQDSIERVWHAALEKVGSLSLAWQSEAAQARVTTAADVDPELVFDNVSKAALFAESSLVASQDSLVPAEPGAPLLDARQQPRFRLRRPPRRSRAVVRPRSITQISNGSSRNTVRSDEHDGMHSVQLAGHRDRILRELAQDGGFSDHVAETRRIKNRRLARSKRRNGSERVALSKKPAAPRVQPISDGAVPKTMLPAQAQTPGRETEPALSPAPTPVSASAPASEPLSSARSQRARRRNRASIRLRRLLPPKASALFQTPIFAGKPRSVSLPVDSGADSSRNHDSLRVPARKQSCTSTGSLCEFYVPAEVGIGTGPAPAHRRTNSLPGAGNELCSYKVQSIGGSGNSDRCLSSLEEKVSGMFTELGLKSPYLDAANVDASHNRRQSIRAKGKSASIGRRTSRDSSVHRRQRAMDAVPWFYQKQYIATDVQQDSTERDVLLVDDDSSCADFAADADCRCCSHLYSAAGLGDGVYGSSRCPQRRFTGTSGLSTADASSAASTAFDYSQQRLLFSSRGQVRGRLSARSNMHFKKSSGSFSASPFMFAGECRACHDQRRPCGQMHNILARIEQTDHYIYSVSQNASAIDSLLADLRAQSRALAETLSISQTRASALGHTVTQAIHKDARNAAYSYEEAESVSSIRGGSVRSEQGKLKDYHALSKKTHELKKRALALGAQSWADAAGAEARHIASASESEYERQATRCQAPLSSPVKAPAMSPMRGHAAKATAKEKHGGKLRARRPEQPISVRMQRIDSQWAELRNAVKQLGLDSKDSADAESANQGIRSDAEMSAIAADGLKLVQRVLKTTLESLSSASEQRVNGD